MKNAFAYILPIAFCCFAGSGSLSASDWIWVEGESSSSDSVNLHPWYAQVDREQLSGGEFISHFDNENEGRARYAFNVEDPGEYYFWVRANPTQAKLEYQLNANDWRPVPLERNRDSVNIAGDGGLDIRFLAWIQMGKVTLPAGSNALEFRMSSSNNHHGSIDCFVFSKERLEPRGILKPDQLAAAAAKADEANKGWFAFKPSTENLGSNSVINLRRLNEVQAGDGGFIESLGGQFVHGRTKEPVRFWAVNGPSSSAKSMEDLRRESRVLAAYGVNMVRIHGAVFDERGEPDLAKVRHIQDIVEAMKGEGIYSHLSIYFPLWFRPGADLQWLSGYDGSKHPFAALYFNDAFQSKYREWWKQLLLTPSQSTGRPLIDEPALFGVEMVNEDSYFFWTFSEQNIPLPQLEILEAQFGEWLTGKYGSLAEAFEAWDNVSLPRDDVASGRVAFRSLWNISSEKTSRDKDTAAFLLDSQTGFYSETYDYLRSLGLKGVITASNWHTANAEIFGPMEKLSYAVTDFVDRHGYFSCNHKGDNAAWSIREGHTYSDRSALRFDPEVPGGNRLFLHPAMDVKYNELPSMVSETTWNRPNRFRSEAPVYFAAFGCLQDSSAIVHFAFDGSDWSVKPNFWTQPWTLMSPAMMGQFPAAALIYREGLISPGDVLADINLNIEEVTALGGSPLPQGAAFDELRLKDVPSGMEIKPGQVTDPLVHFAGQSKVRFSDEPRSVQLSDLSKLIRRDELKVVSSNRQLELDYGNGALLINAPKAQGVSGNLGARGEISLDDITVASPLDLINVLVVSLDGEPLGASRRMLLQVMTEEKATGFETEPAGEGVQRIVKLGNDPWRVKDLAGWIRFKKPVKITTLDLNGVSEARTEVFVGERFSFDPSTVYYLVER